VYTGIMDGCTLVALCPVHAIQVASSVFLNIVYFMMITDAIWK